MKVLLITKRDKSTTGLSRYVESLYQGLGQVEDVEVSITAPAPIPIPRPLARLARWAGTDPGAFFASYPLRCRLEDADVYHLTSQTVATLLCFQRIYPAVVTVLDIIPYLVRHNPELNTLRHPVDALFYRLALAALRRADAIIAISEYTKRTLVEHLSYPPDKIHVVYMAVDSTRFRRRTVPQAFRQEYGLSEDCKYVLYVGSEDPRKNLKTLIRAFALVRHRIQHVRLLKVGAAHFGAERERLLELITELQLDQDVLFLEHVPEEHFPLFYNVAQVLVLPSLYEGFGLPPLEAMASGLPVIAAETGSLPEVIGGGGILVNPYDSVELAEQMSRVFLEHNLRAELCHAALAQSQRFGLGKQSSQSIEVYNQVTSAG